MEEEEEVVAGAVVQTPCPDKPGGKATGNVTDAEHTTLLAGADATDVELTNYLTEEGEATVAEIEEGEGTVVTAIGVIEVTEVTEVTEETEEGEVMVKAEATEALQHSSQETGTALTAVPTTLQAVKHAINAMLPSNHACQRLFLQVG